MPDGFTWEFDADQTAATEGSRSGSPRTIAEQQARDEFSDAVELRAAREGHSLMDTTGNDGQGFVNHWKVRKQRAKERLDHVNRPCWYYPLLALKTSVKSYDFGKYMRLQPVIEPPGEIELAGALSDKTLFGVLGRYSYCIQYELAVDRSIGKDEICTHMAWAVVSALRIRSLAEILVPAVADHSWSTIAAVDGGKCNARLIEDIPMARVAMSGAAIEVTEEHLRWIDDNIDHLVRLLEDPRYRTAVEALTTYHHHNNTRVMVALLWAGIESLFQINAELRFRIAAYIALFLEPRGAACKALYSNVKSMYDVRSKSVHGSGVSEKDLQEHICEVRVMLSRLLCKITEEGKLRSPSELDEMLFC